MPRGIGQFKRIIYHNPSKPKLLSKEAFDHSRASSQMIVLNINPHGVSCSDDTVAIDPTVETNTITDTDTSVPTLFVMRRAREQPCLIFSRWRKVEKDLYRHPPIVKK